MRLIVCMLAVLLLPVVAGGAPAAFQDDFTAYPAGSDGGPAWFAHGACWEVAAGTYRSTDPGHAFSFPDRLGQGKVVTVEATVRVNATTADQWKVAGVTIYADAANYWHLALVEAPDGDSRPHFVELSEALQGEWNAQFALTATADRERQTPWQIGQTYHLRLAMSVQGVSGTVTDDAGSTVAQLGYRFDKPAVTHGRPGVTAGGFDVTFDDFRATVAEPVAETPPAYPPFFGVDGGRRPAADAGSGFFRVAARQGKWTFLDPDGRACWLRGTDHASWHVHWCEKLGYAPYHENVVKLYGPQERWAALTLRRLKSWGFNALGVNSSPSIRHQGLPHMDILGLGQGFAGIDHIVPRGTWTGFPDVFSDRWPLYCDRLARMQCAPQKDDPWLVGYFIDNELEWFGKTWQPAGMIAHIWERPVGHPARVALVRLVRQRHGTIERLNRAWGAKFASFDALAANTEPVSLTSKAALADVRAFARLCAERYFGVAAAAIRRHDPHHLVLGCRFAGIAPEVLDIAGRHCDVVSINCYRTVDLDTGRVLDFERDLRRWHEQSKRPLMITEWSFPALDSGLPCVHGAGQRFATQSQRARAWETFQSLLIRTPFVVGSNYFMWADEPALGISKDFPEDSNYGLVNEMDVPYPELTAACRRVNTRWQQLRAEGPQPAKPVVPAKPTWTPGDAPAPVVETVGTVTRATVGNLVLEKDTGSPYIWDRITLAGVPMGRLSLLLWQVNGGQHWDDECTVTLRGTANASPQGSGGCPLPAKPAVKGTASDEAGGSPPPGGAPLVTLDFLVENAGALPYRAGYQVTLLPGRDWFLARLLWVENTSKEPWTLSGYYHYPRSAIRGDGADETGSPRVPGYYLPFGAWTDQAAGLSLGVLSARLGDYEGWYWKDERGIEHSDLLRKVGVTLKPGETYKSFQPPAAIFAVGEPLLQTLEGIRQELAAM